MTFVSKQSVLAVGELAPSFSMSAVSARDGEAFLTRLEDFRGRWLILVFYPRDFSFVCPTELTAFSGRIEDFHRRDCDLLGISVDTIELHQEWLRTSPSEGGVGPLRFPLAADEGGKAARKFGVWVDDKQVALRGLFVIDPRGVLQYSVVHNLSVGRSADEVLRVLDALRSGGLCPASWTTAEGTLDVDNALRPGRVLGHYRIREVLGRGTFGTVFAAWDLHLERQVALKVLGKAGDGSRDQLLSEARASAGLSHPNICTVFAVEEEDGLPLIVMEYLAGRPLSEVVLRDIGEDLALDIAREIALGLAAAHQRNIVHGDLKLGNIMLSESGTPKILDFGLATRLSEPAAQQDAVIEPESSESRSVLETQVVSVPQLGGTVIAGTPAYMSPEQAFGRQLATASDSFAFGLILFELLTGQQAMSGLTGIEMILRLRSETLATTLPPRVPRRFQPLLSSLLDPAPEKRPSLSQVARELKSVS